MRSTAANNVNKHRLVEFRIGGFESCPERLGTLMNSRIRTPREILEIEASKSGIKVVQRDQALPQLRGLKEKRIGLQAAEEGLQILAVFDFRLARIRAGSG